MKIFIKLFSIIILVTVIGFLIAACGDDPGGGDPPPPRATVTSVTVSAAKSFVNKGGTLQFNAVVNGANSPSQKVTWSIFSIKTAGTTISSSGLLTAASNETELMLTIRATSTVDPTKSGYADITVDTEGLDTLNGNISITVNGSPVTAVTAETELTATYSGSEIVTYHWYRDSKLINYTTSSTCIPYRNGGYIVLVSANGYNSKVSKFVSVTGENSPDGWPEEDRWVSWAFESTATIEHSVDSEGVCTIIVDGIPMTHNEIEGYNAWRASADYSYSAEINTRYAYEFEAWTKSGTRTLNIQYYEDGEFGLYSGFQITTESREYTVIGDAIPKGGIHPFRFMSGDQTGTFYVKMLNIRKLEGPPENWSVKDRWSTCSSSSTATMDYYSVSNDDVCTITIGGIPANDWDIQTRYAYTAKANTAYKYEFKAWTDSSLGHVGLKIHYRGDDDEYWGGIIPLTNNETTYVIYGENILVGGSTTMIFHWADQTGTFHVKILSIEEDIPDPSDLGTPGLAYELINNGTAYRVRKGTVTSGAVVIPTFYNGKRVREIGSGDDYYDNGGAFSGTGITSVTIPIGVMSIGRLAFANCTDLIEINIPVSVTSIHMEAFSDCTSLTSINIPIIMYVGYVAFQNWTSLQTINIEGHADRQSTIDAGWFEVEFTDGKIAWDDDCGANIVYLRN